MSDSLEKRRRHTSRVARHTHSAAVGLLAVLSLTCGAPQQGAKQTPTWHQDIAPVVAGRCVSCHQPGEIGPFSLRTYAEAAPMADAIAASVTNRTMPPWGAEPGHRRYTGDPSLPEETIEAFAAWAAAGAPEGDPSTAAEPWPELVSTSIRSDTTLRAAEPYAVNGDPDDYRCFVLPWRDTEETDWVTGFTVDVDNREVLHHVAAYLFRPDGLLADTVISQLEAWDADDPEPGYACFGGPSGDSESQIPAIQLAQWVPGMSAVSLPSGSGIEVPPGSVVVLQFHYFDGGTTRQVDQTGLVLQLDESVDVPGSFAPWLSATWPVAGMDIPAGEADVVHTAEADPRGFFELVVAGIDLSEGFDIHSALFHMHRLGTRGELAVTHADGAEETILVVDPWDFDWQRVYGLETPTLFRDGDTLRVSCHFDNSGQNPATHGEPVDVSWGEGSDDEMCVGNMFITEPMENR